MFRMKERKWLSNRMTSENSNQGALTVWVCQLRAKLHSQQSHEEPSSSNVARRGISQHVDVDQIPCRLPPRKWTGFLWNCVSVWECFFGNSPVSRFKSFPELWVVGIGPFVVNLESKNSSTFISDGWTRSLVQTTCLEPKLVPHKCIWQHLFCVAQSPKLLKQAELPIFYICINKLAIRSMILWYYVICLPNLTFQTAIFLREQKRTGEPKASISISATLGNIDISIRTVDRLTLTQWRNVLPCF